MSIELVKKYAPYTDEVMKAESKISLLTNTDFDWKGAHTVSVWKITTSEMNDYKRNAYSEDDTGISRFGDLFDLNAQTEEMMLKNDRSFIFNIDNLDQDETAEQVEAGKALNRQLREKVIPEIDTYTYKVMAEKAGTIPEAVALTKDNIYDEILKGNETLDNAEVPESDRVLILTPASYTLLKKASALDNTDVADELKKKGVVGYLDGLTVIKVPANRLPENFGLMLAHPCATVAPVKLEDYGIHQDTPLSSGTIVTGRVVYDAFVLDNKRAAIYYQPIA